MSAREPSPTLAAACAGAFGALAVLGACSGEPADGGVEVPAFARSLPGETAAVLFAREGALPGALGDESARLAGEVARLGGEDLWRIERHGPGVVAAVLLGVASGWRDLAESRTFRAALSELDPRPAALLFVDLQQVVDVGRSRLASDAARLAPVLDILGLEAFQYGAVGFRATGAGGFTFRGVIRTTGDPAGLAAVLGEPPGSASLLAGVAGVTGVTGGAGGAGGAGADEDGAGGATLALEAQLDVGAIERMLVDLGGDGNMFQTMAAGALAGGVQDAVRAVLRHLGGRVSLRAGGRGVAMAVSVRDRDGLRDVLDRYLRERSSDAWDFPGDARLYLAGDRLVLLPGAVPSPRDERAPNLTRDTALDASLELAVRWPDGRSVELSLVRSGSDPGRIGVAGSF